MLDQVRRGRARGAGRRELDPRRLEADVRTGTVVTETDASTDLGADDDDASEAHDALMTITRRTNRCDVVLALIDKCLGEYEQMLVASHIDPATQSRKGLQTCSVS